MLDNPYQDPATDIMICQLPSKSTEYQNLPIFHLCGQQQRLGTLNGVVRKHTFLIGYRAYAGVLFFAM